MLIKSDLKGKSFLKLLDFTPEQINYLLDLAADMKAQKKNGVPHRIFEGNVNAPKHNN